MIVMLSESVTETFYCFGGEGCFKLEADSYKGKCAKIAKHGSSQEETNTKALLHAMYASENHHLSAMLVRSSVTSSSFFSIIQPRSMQPLSLRQCMAIIGVCLM